MSVDLHWIRTTISSGVSHSGIGRIVSSPSGGSGGGENPPYGTILSTGIEPVTSSFTYADSPYSTGSFSWGSYPYYTRADGAGGSYLDFTTGYSLGTETATFNQVMNDDVLQVNSRIIYKGGSGFTDPSAGTWSECLRVDFLTGNSGMGYVYANINGTDYQTGSYSYVERGNGTCGVYNDYTYDYSAYPYGTYLTTWYDFASSTTYDSYADGAGGYYDIPQ